MKKNIYLGLFLVALSTLMLEVILTRIFSVTMWYHFAFIAISIAMFGLTLGGVIVYLFFKESLSIINQLALNALLFSITAVISLLIQLQIRMPLAAKSIVSFASTYALMTVPFIFSGVCLSLTLTRFPSQINQLYAVDLAGSAIGCIFLIILLKITDAPTIVVVIACLASLAAVLFAENKLLKRISLFFCLFFLVFFITNSYLLYKGTPLIRTVWVKGQKERKPLYEKWNQFSRVDVWGNTRKFVKPFTWGLSPVYPLKERVKQLSVTIDSSAGSSITNFDGDLNKLNYLKYDITNLAHYLKPDSDVLVIGAGGGRDILSALVFGQKSVTAVEVNGDIIDAVNNKFGNFSGHLDRNPKVSFVSDEARSYVARENKKFDIIELSLVDTWAATAAGALVLTENALYTVEGWKIFFNHLNPQGVLTISRSYVQKDPREVYRLTSLAFASLKASGVENPRNHIFLVKSKLGSTGKTQGVPDGVATMIVSKDAFTENELKILEETTQKLQFDILLSPTFSMNSIFKTLTSKDRDMFLSRFPLNLTAPTDNDPFFFQMFRLRDILNEKLRNKYSKNINMKVVFILGDLLIIVVALTLICIILPLLINLKKVSLKEAVSLSIFFLSIGMGFMLIEVSQMQRLIVFLGHPTYSLSVVLFTLFLSGGMGSYLGKLLHQKSKICLFVLLCILFIFGSYTSAILNIYENYGMVYRIVIAMMVLFPLGLFMGMPFAFGMRMASKDNSTLTPWLWGINGAASVTASVLGMIISLQAGISATFWTGFAFYLVAFLSILNRNCKSA